MGYGLFRSSESRSGNNLLRCRVLKSKSIEITRYRTRHVRLVEYAEKGVVQYYIVEVSDTGQRSEFIEKMRKDYNKALSLYESYSTYSIFKHKKVRRPRPL